MVESHAADPKAEPFRSQILRYRGRTGLTQHELADRMGASRRTVQDWESGSNYPKAERLKVFILALLEAGGLTVGHEREEAQELWAAVLRDSPRMRSPLDEVWLTRLLADRAAPRQPPEVVPDVAPFAIARSAAEREAVERREDWGEAPDVLGFVGRGEELTTLRAWVLEERSRLVAVLGIGGIGKTTLAARLAQDVWPTFQRMYWRSVRDALPTTEWLGAAIGFFSDWQVLAPEGEAARLGLLLELLRERPSLLVLDNLETLLEPGEREGRYREGYSGYGRLLQAMGEGRHQSCLVVTSREAPPELASLGGGAVRTLQLGGLGVAEAQVLLADKQLSGSTTEWADLIARFGGNGLALKIVAESIRQLFGGDLGAFLEESGSGTVFGGIRRLLAEQIGRSSPLEQDVLRALAVEREPINLAELLGGLGRRAGRGALLEAIEALRRRSLVERVESAGPAAVHPLVGFTLQSVVLEYVTDRLVTELADEITRAQPVLLVEQPLIKANAKEYVRQTQERLIGEPVLRHLQAEHGRGGAPQEGGLEQRLLALLERWRDRPHAEQGFGPGNVVNLLRLARGHLRNLDLSRLALRQAYLAGVEAQDASLAGAHLAEAALAEAFSFPISVALSGDGASLAAGTSTGEVWLWRVADRTLLLAVRGHAGPVFGVALSGDGRLLASRSFDGTVKLWEGPSARLMATLQGHTAPGWGVALSADGLLLAGGGEDGTVRLWEVASGRLLATLQGHAGLVYGVALSVDGRLLASGGLDGTIRLWEASGGRSLATLQGHTGGVMDVALSADGRLLANSTFDGIVRLWDARSGRLLTTLQGHTGAVRSVALSADGRLLASGGFDRTVRLWDVPGRRLLTTLQGHTGGVWGVALSADGRLLAGGGEDGTVRLWETPSGRPLATFQGHAGLVYSVSLSADGQLLASGSFDGTVRLWETNSRRLLATLQRHTGSVYGVALSADGQLLVSGGDDGTVRLWEASGGAHLATLRSDRRYERLDITGLTGVTAGQREALLALGAVHRLTPAGPTVAGTSLS